MMVFEFSVSMNEGLWLGTQAKVSQVCLPHAKSLYYCLSHTRISKSPSG